MEFTHFVGIDISKKTVDVALVDAAGAELSNQNVTNSSLKLIAYFKKLFKKHGIEQSQVLLGCEATGRYSSSLKIAVEHMQLAMMIEPHWKYVGVNQSRTKNDKIDALRISQTLRRYHDELHLWESDSKTIEKLRSLVSTRDMAMTVRTTLSVSIAEAEAAEDLVDAKIRKKYLRKLIKSAEKEIEQIDRDIDEVIRCDQEIWTNYKLVTSVPGIGKRNAVALIIYSQNFTRFANARQMACYCGVAPFDDSSGTSRRRRPRVSHRANKKLKSLLYLASLSAKRHSPKIGQFYLKKIEKGKHAMSAIIAVANKLLHFVFAVVKNQEPYQEQYISKYYLGATA